MPYYTRPTTTFGGGRPTTLITPNAFNPAKTYPLVLLLHSYGASGADIRSRLGFSDLHNADDGCFILAPDGQNFGGNNYWDYWTAGGTDFVYLKQLVDDVCAAWPIDPAKVFVVGYSNGGFMAHQLVLAYPGRFSAKFTLAAGGGTNDSTATGTATPSVAWHGDGDLTVLTGGDAAAATLPGILAGHGGVGSTGYKSAAATAADINTRNGGVGALGANYGSIDLVTAAAGAETTRQAYPGLPASAAAEKWTGVGVDHSISFASNKGQVVLQWMIDHHR